MRAYTLREIDRMRCFVASRQASRQRVTMGSTVDFLLDRFTNDIRIEEEVRTMMLGDIDAVTL